MAEKIMDEGVKAIVLKALYGVQHRIWDHGEVSGYVTSQLFQAKAPLAELH
jgi:methionine salvage enolase-phosphatase E1